MDVAPRSARRGTRVATSRTSPFPGARTLISTWLATQPLEWFLDAHFGREPLVRPATARDAIPLLTWTTVERLVAARAEMLVIRNGVRRAGQQPLTPSEARNLLDYGYSLVIRGCDRLEAGLRGLAERFALELPGEVGVQAFVTPAGYCTFGWHYDCEDVFIAQTSGQKQYRMRRNTVNPRPRLDAMPHDAHFERETSPMLACTLLPGDWVYVPRGWWHMAYATRDSLSLSVGVLSRDARGAAAAGQAPAGEPVERRAAAPASSE